MESTLNISANLRAVDTIKSEILSDVTKGATVTVLEELENWYKVKTEDMLCHFVREALKYDDSVLIEEFIDGREIESAVLGNENPMVAEVGEVVSANEFYDFESKYENPESRVEIPANISKDISDKIKELAVKAYKAVRCRGLSRVDFFVEKGTDRIILNEINTLPGFTDISMYPMMWANMGFEGSKLIDELIKYAKHN